MSSRPIRDVPPADVEAMHGRLANSPPAVFLDFDGTLSPIVDEPTAATISESMREAVRRLSDSCLVAIVSGRDVVDVRERVGLDGIAYAGSHGFDIIAPDGNRTANPEAERFLPLLDRVEGALMERLRDIRGAIVDRKRFAIAVHYRMVDDESLDAVRQIVEEVADAEPDLRRSGGKKVYELRPNLDWDKGKAVHSLLDMLSGDSEPVPMYIGDDETDEDAFRAIGADGISVVVRGENDSAETLADYSLANPDAVERFLNDLQEGL